MRRRFFRLLLVLIIVAAISAAVMAQTPQMAFTQITSCPPTDEDCPWYSVIVTPSGRTAGPNDGSPTWSADGTKIGFSSNWDIFVADATGANAVNISNTANNYDPAWSPDGNRIAFMTTRDGHPELYLMNPDGSNVVRLTYNNAISVGFPAWARDGAHIAFNCEVENGNGDLCTIKPDGTDFVRLTTDPCTEFGPTWSPDSQNIAFISCQFGIAVMNADGTNVRQLGVWLEGFGRLAWSPDGAQIAFGSTFRPSPAAEEGYLDIYLMQADGTNVRRLGLGTYFNGATEPAWMPVQVPIASLTFICNGLTCSFDASGSSDPYATITSYEWDFGDQTTGTGATVSHVYASGAPYTAKLTVKDSNGATGTKFQTIPANPPDAVFQFWCNGHTCNFDASGSKDSGGTITSYSWNFGDGGTGTGITVSHTYAASNYYNVTLTVADSTAHTGTQTKRIDANNSPPQASFLFACNLLTCSFDSSHSVDSDGTIVSYGWNFGDGISASGPSPMASHTYTASGPYTVALTVIDNRGATSVQSQPLFANSPPVAAFNFSCSMLTCTFDGSASHDSSNDAITMWSWNFGDGTSGSNTTTMHSYSKPGTYVVTLTVTDGHGATSSLSSPMKVPTGKH